MASNNRFKKEMNEDIFDDWLCSTGFLYPVNELQLARFESLFKDYEFELSKVSINIKAIFEEKLCKVSQVDNIVLNSEEINEIETLKMAARKGQKSISKDTLDKLTSNHKKRSSDNE